MSDPVELGVELLANFEDEELDLPTALDRLEAVTTEPRTTRTILDEAEKRGIVAREDGILRVRSSEYVSYGSDVVVREGEFTCRRCGASLSTGHFIEFEHGELGPFGSSCIRKVTGRR